MGRSVCRTGSVDHRTIAMAPVHGRHEWQRAGHESVAPGGIRSIAPVDIHASTARRESPDGAAPSAGQAPAPYREASASSGKSGSLTIGRLHANDTMHFLHRLALAALLAGTCLAASARDFHVNPESYLPYTRGLRPGDTLLLAPGVYRDGLRVHNLVGTAAAPIRIRAADPTRRPLFIARPGANTVSLVDVDYVEIADLDLNGLGIPVDAVKAEGHARFAHHVTLERLRIVNHGRHRLNVAISTKCPAWGWVIRDNEIYRAGTGLYLGNSDGRAPFVGGLIERNLVLDSIGYDLQIKHQKPRPTDAGLPTWPSVTVIRRNVFSKAVNAARGEHAQPNVLVGHFPGSGDGAADRYVIHGNLFHENPSEALFQGEGNIALYNNVFVNRHGSAVHIQPHNGVPGEIDIFGNTVLANGHGISVTGGDPAKRQRVRDNVAFANPPLQGSADTSGNLVGSFDGAIRHLRRAVGPLEAIDLRPVRPVRGRGTRDTVLPDADHDFCGVLRSGATPGAFVDEGPAPKLSIRRRLAASAWCTDDAAGKPARHP